MKSYNSIDILYTKLHGKQCKQKLTGFFSGSIFNAKDKCFSNKECKRFETSSCYDNENNTRYVGFCSADGYKDADLDHTYCVYEKTG